MGLARFCSGVLSDFFNIDYYQSGVKYDVASTILCVDVFHRPEIFSEFRDRGFPIVIDNLWERKHQYQISDPDDDKIGRAHV